MVHSLLAIEYDRAGQLITEVIGPGQIPLVIYAPRNLEGPDSRPNGAAAVFARTFVRPVVRIAAWPGDADGIEYGLFQPDRPRQFARMCTEAVQRGYGAVAVDRPLDPEPLARLLPRLHELRDIAAIRRVLARLDLPSDLSARWAYLAGFAHPSHTPWTLFQATDSALVDRLVDRSRSIPDHRVDRRHPPIPGDARGSHRDRVV